MGLTPSQSDLTYRLALAVVSLDAFSVRLPVLRIVLGHGALRPAMEGLLESGSYWMPHQSTLARRVSWYHAGRVVHSKVAWGVF